MLIQTLPDSAARADSGSATSLAIAPKLILVAEYGHIEHLYDY